MGLIRHSVTGYFDLGLSILKYVVKYWTKMSCNSLLVFKYGRLEFFEELLFTVFACPTIPLFDKFLWN